MCINKQVATNFICAALFLSCCPSRAFPRENDGSLLKICACFRTSARPPPAAEVRKPQANCRQGYPLYGEPVSCRWAETDYCHFGLLPARSGLNVVVGHPGGPKELKRAVCLRLTGTAHARRVCDLRSSGRRRRRKGGTQTGSGDRTSWRRARSLKFNCIQRVSHEFQLIQR